MKNNNWKWIVGVIIIIIVLIVLFSWGRWASPYREQVGEWESLGIKCLLNGHTNLAQHIHPNIKIVVGGIEEVISSDIGITPSCMAEMHTHDASGKIHIETSDASKKFDLETFFKLSKQPFDREGYQRMITVNGKSDATGGALILEDEQQIIVTYDKK